MTSEWKQSGIDRRDFRHMKSEPEIPKHKKKSKKVDHSKCEHDLKMTAEHTGQWRNVVIGRKDEQYRWVIRNFKCRLCGYKTWTNGNEYRAVDTPPAV
jgi:hypothetical protein